MVLTLSSWGHWSLSAACICCSEAPDLSTQVKGRGAHPVTVPHASGCWKHLFHLAEVHLKTSPKVDWQLLGGTKSATQGNPCRMFSSFSTKHHLYNITLKSLSFTIQSLEPETTMPCAVNQIKQILNCVASNFFNLEMLFCSLSASTICFIIVVTFIS